VALGDPFSTRERQIRKQRRVMKVWECMRAPGAFFFIGGVRPFGERKGGVRPGGIRVLSHRDMQPERNKRIIPANALKNIYKYAGGGVGIQKVWELSER